LYIEAEKLKVKAFTGAKLKLEGSSAFFEGKANSGSSIKAEELTVNNCAVKVGSSARVRLNVTDSLKARSNTGGHLFYSGNPKITDNRSSMGGNTDKIEQEL